MLVRRCFRALALVAATLLSTAGSAFAQADWPAKPIRMVVPLAAGGSVDTVARIFAERLSVELGQQVVVENQGGAGGTIAAGNVSRAPADGYTLIFSSTSAAVINALLFKNLSYDPVKGFTAVSLVATSPLVAVIATNVPAKNLNEFIGAVREHPEKYTYGSSGNGTITHVAGEYFKSVAGLNMTHVPYRGNSAVYPDLLAGRVSMMFDSLPAQIPLIREGRVRALAIVGKDGSAELPDVPTTAKILPAFQLEFWMGLYAPAGTPKPVVDRIASAVGKVAHDPAVQKRLEKLGAKGVGSSAAEFDAFWHSQMDKYRGIIEANHITMGQ